MPHTTELQRRLKMLDDDSPEARERLIEHACERLRTLTCKMLRQFPRVQRWFETDDVLQNAMLRLHRSLASVRPKCPTEFYGLAATQIRRELLDLAKHFFGPEGHGANHHTDDGELVSQKQGFQIEPANLDAWARFHEAVNSLPMHEKQVVDLLWYEDLGQLEAAKVLEISLATVKRRWTTARLTLCGLLDEWQIG
jgi:RNA polymerase sigma factor (sigma-70 family)